MANVYKSINYLNFMFRKIAGIMFGGNTIFVIFRNAEFERPRMYVNSSFVS